MFPVSMYAQHQYPSATSLLKDKSMQDSIMTSISNDPQMRDNMMKHMMMENKNMHQMMMNMMDKNKMSEGNTLKKDSTTSKNHIHNHLKYKQKKEAL